MKMIIAVIQDYDTDAFLKALCSHGLTGTRIASAGGFLRAGNTTVFMAVEDEQVDLVKGLLNQHCRLREDMVPIEELAYVGEEDLGQVCATRIGGGVAFVARITQFERMTRAVSETAKTTMKRS
jgi:uncharacterized protein YaaQ